MKKLLKSHYGLELLSIEKSSVGAGSDTFFVTCSDGKYVVKYPASSEINHPEAEPELSMTSPVPRPEATICIFQSEDYKREVIL